MKRRKNQKNNKGFSMVELLIAFGIMGVIVTTVGYMMTTSSKTYSSLSTEAQLQAEAQLVANAVSELAIDSFNAGNIEESSFEVNTDPAVTNKLVLLSKTRDGDKTRYVITHNATTKELRLTTDTYSETSKAYSSTDRSDPPLIGQYIEEFKVNLNRVKNENIISFELTYSKNGRKFKGDYQVLMRNRAYADKEAKDEPEITEPKGLTLTPKTIYVDIVKGSPVGIRQNSITGALEPGSVINFDSTVLFDGSKFDGTENGAYTWKYTGGSDSVMTLTKTTGSMIANVEQDGKSSLTFESDKKDIYAALPSADISVIASYEYTHNHKELDADGNEKLVSQKHLLSREAKVRLRIVRKILWSGTTNVSGWKSSYALMGGKEVTDANGYASAKSNVILMPYIDQSNVSSDLTWKLEQRGSDGNWVTCTDTNLAQFMSGTVNGSVRQTSGARQSMTIKLGANATNAVSFRITATSVFDDSVSAQYILGVIPVKSAGGNNKGLNSRGYKIPLEEYFTNPDDPHKVQDDWPDIYEIVDVTMTGGDNNDGDNTKRFHWDKNTRTFYWDINSFSYSNMDQKEEFYKERQVNMNITYRYLLPNGSVAPETKTYNAFHYVIKAVKVSPTTTGPSIVCMRKGDTINYVTLMDNYNVTKRSDFGLYVKDYADTKWGSNLNRDGWENTNQYLNIPNVTTYGTSDNYKDNFAYNVTAKVSEKSYPKDYLTMRLTVEDFYNIHQNVNSYYDYKIYIANVEGLGVYLPGPNSSVGWISGSLPNAANKAVTVTGIDTDGNAATGKVYQDGNKVKCIYGANTYTYNKTYNYWKK